MERSASDVWLRLGRGKATLPYLTSSYCWNLELVVLDVSLSLSLLSSDRQPPKVREGTTALSIYTVVHVLD